MRKQEARRKGRHRILSRDLGQGYWHGRLPMVERKKIATCDAATDTQDFTEWRLKEVEARVENMLGSFQREQQMSAIEAGRVGDEQGRIGSSIEVGKTLQMVD